MKEQPYPIQSECCEKTLYGPVIYCPYCGDPISQEINKKADVELADVDEVYQKQSPLLEVEENKLGKNKENELIQEPVNQESFEDSLNEEMADSDQGPVLQQKPTEISEDPDIKIEVARKELEQAISELTIDKVKPRKWIIMIPITIVIVGLIAYFVFHGKKQPEMSNLPTQAKPIESMISDTLHQGVQLSIVINTISKQENLINAAKRLLEISPTNPEYKKQLDSAESKLPDLSDNKVQAFNLYVETIMQLTRSNPSEISSAIGSVKKGDLSNREKLIMDLIEKHLNSLGNERKPDKNIWLSDFTQNFSNFND